MWRYNNLDELCHYGVKGMRWGVRRYQNKDGSLTSAGKDRYSSDKRSRLVLSDKQKKAIKIGAAVVGSGLLIYGGIKVSQMVNRNGKTISGAIPENFAKKLPEGSSEKFLEGGNPYFNTVAGKNNCTSTALAGFFRLHGFDVRAMSTNGKGNDLIGVVQGRFKFPSTGSSFEAREIKSLASSSSFINDPEAFIKKHFRLGDGENASGVASLNFPKKSIFETRGRDSVDGHAFTWELKNGAFVVHDQQVMRTYKGDLAIRYLKMFDPAGLGEVIRLDNAEPIKDKLSEVIDIPH